MEIFFSKKIFIIDVMFYEIAFEEISQPFTKISVFTRNISESACT